MKTVGFEIGNQLIGVMGGDAIMEEVMKTAEPTPKMIPVEVLDKIRAEIETKIKEENYGVISDHTHEDGLEEALEIIDKYTKGESE